MSHNPLSTERNTRTAPSEHYFEEFEPSIDEIQIKDFDPRSRLADSSIWDTHYGQTDQKETIDRIVKEAQKAIAEKVSKEALLRRVEFMANKKGLNDLEKKKLLLSMEEMHRDKMYENYDQMNKYNHSLRCGIINLAHRKLKSDEEVINNSMGFLKRFLEKRRLDLTMPNINKFNQAMQILSASFIRYTESLSKRKLRYFARWSRETFETRREMIKVVRTRLKAHEALTRENRNSYFAEHIFNYKFKSRLLYRVRQAFTKWRLMSFFNYPFYTKRHARVYGLIANKVFEHNRRVRKTALANKPNQTHERAKSQQVVSSKKKFLDIPLMISKLSIGFNAIAKATHRQFEEVFVHFKISHFSYEAKNMKTMEKRAYGVKMDNLGLKEMKPSQLIQYLLAQQTFIYSYKRSLFAALNKLRFHRYSVLSDEKLKEISVKVADLRAQARLELITKLFTRVYLRWASRSIIRWRLQSELRKATLVKSVMKAESLSLVKEKDLFLQIKGYVITLAEKYSVTMMKSLSRNVGGDSGIVIGIINKDLDNMIGELFDSL